MADHPDRHTVPVRLSVETDRTVKSARNNHLVWFICLAIFNTVGILPIVYLILNKNKAIPNAA